MIYAIARIDKSARARLSWIQSFAASFGIVPKPIYGHITLCNLEESDLEAHKAALEEVAAVSVNVESVTVPENSPAVVALVAADSGLNHIRSKLGNDTPWTPNIELLRDPLVNPKWVLMAMAENFEPFTATVDRIEFVRPAGRGFEVVDALDLK